VQAHRRGVGNRAVRVAKGQSYGNPLRGVILRAHLWRGTRRSGALVVVQEYTCEECVEKTGTVGAVLCSLVFVYVGEAAWCLRKFEVQRKSSRCALAPGVHTHVNLAVLPLTSSVRTEQVHQAS
jgi:hypothetical protein